MVFQAYIHKYPVFDPITPLRVNTLNYVWLIIYYKNLYYLRDLYMYNIGNIYLITLLYFFDNTVLLFIAESKNPLLIKMEREFYLLKNFLRRRSLNETWNVHINKSCHQVLTVKSIHNATMSRDNIAEVLNNTNTITVKLTTPSKF